MILNVAKEIIVCIRPIHSYLTVVRSFTLHSTTNPLKANKAIPALFFMMSTEQAAGTEAA